MTSTSLRRRTFATIAALALLGAACGGDDDGGGDGDGGGGTSGDEEAAADSPIGQALTEEFMADEDSPIGGTEADARCVSGKVVNGIGEDRLVELGVSADNVGDIEDIGFTEGEIETIVDSMFDCVDLQAMLAEEMTADFGGEGAECVAEQMDQGFVRDMMVSAMSGQEEMPDEFFQEFLDIAAECDLPLG